MANPWLILVFNDFFGTTDAMEIRSCSMCIVTVTHPLGEISDSLNNFTMMFEVEWEGDESSFH